MKAVWHFENEEHKEIVEGWLYDCLAMSNYKVYPKELDAALEFRKQGVLDLE